MTRRERLTFAPPDVNNNFVNVGDSPPIHIVKSLLFDDASDGCVLSDVSQVEAFWGGDIEFDVEGAGSVSFGSGT